MKTGAFVLAGAALLLPAWPVMAQAQGSSAQKGSVNEYLCTFAGKCDGASADATPTIAAPATKGFRLAAPQAAAASASAAAAPVRTAGASAPRAVRRASVTTGAAPRANLRLAFGYNSDMLTPTAQARARTFAQALVTPELRDKRFLIEGHTDSRGARALNIDLSRRRAQAVADFLAQHGVDSSRVEVKGVGPDEPLAGQPVSAEANRRVEAVLLS